MSRRVLAALGWYALPVAVVLLALGYVGLALTRQVNPPVIPVTGTSMLPTLSAGELVVLDHADTDLLRVGDVIAFRVSAENQEQYGTPPRYVHRIVEIDQGDNGVRQFRTRGDNVDGNDPFWVLERNVVGVVDTSLPFAGWPMLFAQSREGKLFGLAVVVVIALYFAMGAWDERRASKLGEVVTVGSLAEETRALRTQLETQFETVPPRPDTAVPPPEQTASFEQLVASIEGSAERQERTEEMLERLVSAVSEYGEHLRSHTAVIQGMAGSATNLEKVTERLAQVVEADRTRSDHRQALSPFHELVARVPDDVRRRALEEAERIIAEAQRSADAMRRERAEPDAP